MSSGGIHPSRNQQQPLPIQGSLGDGTRPRAWRVIHACEYARNVLPVVDGQVAAGMRPYIVTPQGAGSAELYLSGRRQEQPRSLSLLRSWQDVRNWRKSILDSDPESSADIVHTHCFAAGMAAVRNIGGVVYDLAACIEELAISAGQCEPGSWMGRSFRVAEQFILSRAAAVVVHSAGMKEAAIERGAPPESIFLIPDPLPIDDEEVAFVPCSREQAFRSRFSLPSDAVTLLLPQCTRACQDDVRQEQITVLESLAIARHDNTRFRLLLDGLDGSSRKPVLEHAGQIGIADQIRFVDQKDSAAAWDIADVVLATGDLPADPVVARRANETCFLAMCRGKALLAADVPRNRDVSPDGRGCLWFEPNNARDLAFRLAFLARNPEFLAALAAAGRFYILETRNGKAIGQQYRETYRYAFNRKRSTGPGTGMASLQPAANWV